MGRQLLHVGVNIEPRHLAHRDIGGWIIFVAIAGPRIHGTRLADDLAASFRREVWSLMDFV